MGTSSTTDTVTPSHISANLLQIESARWPRRRDGHLLSRPPLMIQLQVIAPVLLPALFILCRAERFFLPVTDNSYAIRGDAIRDKSSLKRFGAILPKCRSREHTTRRRRTWSALRCSHDGLGWWNQLTITTGVSGQTKNGHHGDGDRGLNNGP
jgi:hypothetical protein